MVSLELAFETVYRETVTNAGPPMRGRATHE